MPTLNMESFVAAPAAAVWDSVKDIRSPERLTNMVHVVEVISDTERACHIDGGKLVERIISVDEDHRRVAYTVDASPFPIDHHNAAFTVTDEGEGCRLSWVIDLEPTAFADTMRPAMAAEFDAIVDNLTR